MRALSRAAFVALGATYALTLGAFESKRPITVEDAVSTATLADPAYLAGAPAEDRVALFSPDKRYFVVLLKQANLADNTNVFSLLLYRSADVFSDPAPHRLLRLSSSSHH